MFKSPTKQSWEQASRLLEQVVKLELCIDTELNDWRYRLTIVDANGLPRQSLTHTGPRTYRLSELDQVQAELMTYRAGMAWAFAQLED